MGLYSDLSQILTGCAPVDPCLPGGSHGHWIVPLTNLKRAFETTAQSLSKRMGIPRIMGIVNLLGVCGITTDKID